MSQKEWGKVSQKEAERNKKRPLRHCFATAKRACGIGSLLADAKLCHQFGTVCFIFGDSLYIINTVLVQKIFYQ